MKKLGLIGGLGPEATIGYYRLLIKSFQERTGSGNYPEFIINSLDMQRITELLNEDRWDDLAETTVGAIQAVAAAGADFAAISSNTPHIVLEKVRKTAPIPVISLVEATCDMAKMLGQTKLGLFGTRFTMQADFYQKVFTPQGIAIIVPELTEQEFIHNKIINELESGILVASTKRWFLAIANRLKEEAAIDGLILGCTELSLLLNRDELGIPFLDTAAIHVEKIVDRMLED